MLKNILKKLNLLPLLFLFFSKSFALPRTNYNIKRSRSLYNILSREYNLTPRPGSELRFGKDKEFIVMISTPMEDLETSLETSSESDRKGKVLFDGEEVGCLWYKDPSEKSRKEFVKEKTFLEDVKHPNIIKINGYLDTKEHFLIFTENGDKSLHDFIEECVEKDINISLYKKIKILKDIASGLAYMHELGYVHRDIKPKNIVLFFDNDQITAKIIDFTSYEKIDDGYRGIYSNVNTRCTGTLYYMDPWNLNDAFDEYDTNVRLFLKNDIYSYGVLMYDILNEFFFGNEFNIQHSPGKDISVEDFQSLFFDKIVSEQWRPQMIKKDIPESLVSLMKRCWDDRPAKRPTANKIFEELVRIEEELIINLK